VQSCSQSLTLNSPEEIHDFLRSSRGNSGRGGNPNNNGNGNNGNNGNPNNNGNKGNPNNNGNNGNPNNNGNNGHNGNPNNNGNNGNNGNHPQEENSSLAGPFTDELVAAILNVKLAQCQGCNIEELCFIRSNSDCVGSSIRDVIRVSNWKIGECTSTCPVNSQRLCSLSEDQLERCLHDFNIHGDQQSGFFGQCPDNANVRSGSLNEATSDASVVMATASLVMLVALF
jgi:hypothetical protein